MSIPRVPGCTLTLHGQAAGGLDGGETVQIEVTRPEHLGSTRSDGFPVTYNGADVSLETLVIDMADKYGIPPQYLMSQVTKEAWKFGEAPRYNPYSYRYEPWGFDFSFITGDERTAYDDTSGHKLDAGSQRFRPHRVPILQQGLEAGGEGDPRPRPVCGVAGDSCPNSESQNTPTHWKLPNLHLPDFLGLQWGQGLFGCPGLPFPVTQTCITPARVLAGC